MLFLTLQKWSKKRENEEKPTSRKLFSTRKAVAQPHFGHFLPSLRRNDVALSPIFRRHIGDKATEYRRNEHEISPTKQADNGNGEGQFLHYLNNALIISQ